MDKKVILKRWIIGLAPFMLLGFLAVYFIIPSEVSHSFWKGLTFQETLSKTSSLMTDFGNVISAVFIFIATVLVIVWWAGSIMEGKFDRIGSKWKIF